MLPSVERADPASVDPASVDRADPASVDPADPASVDPGVAQRVPPVPPHPSSVRVLLGLVVAKVVAKVVANVVAKADSVPLASSHRQEVQPALTSVAAATQLREARANQHLGRLLRAGPEKPPGPAEPPGPEYQVEVHLSFRAVAKVRGYQTLFWQPALAIEMPPGAEVWN